MAARLRPLSVDAPMSLWLADLCACPSSDEMAWLDQFERQRAARFRLARDRNRYVAAHVALRLLVADHGGVMPACQRYERDALGKWHLGNRPAVQFSLSYAGDVALIGIARDQAIGVDVERNRVVDDAADLAALHFDVDEQAAYAASRRRGDTGAFLRGWTRKEACLKAIGTGLNLAPSSLHTGLDGRARVAAGDIALELGSMRIGGLIAAWARIC